MQCFYSSKLSRTSLNLCCVILACLLSGIRSVALAQDQNAAVPLMHDYDQAVEKAKVSQRPLLVVLGAEWCGPCKVLEKELALPAATAIFKNWIVVKVDIDEEPGLAKDWQVSSIPAFRILGVDQEVVASNEGFGNLKKLLGWLDENFDSADPKTQTLFQSDTPVDADVVAELVKKMKDKRPAYRKRIVDRLVKCPIIAKKPIVASLLDGNLSQKIVALEILEKWSAPVSGLDPWQPDTINADRMKLIADWVEQSIDP
jgi:thioredoxin-like negative regulator of GroEL